MRRMEVAAHALFLEHCRENYAKWLRDKGVCDHQYIPRKRLDTQLSCVFCRSTFLPTHTRKRKIVPGNVDSWGLRESVPLRSEVAIYPKTEIPLPTEPVILQWNVVGRHLDQFTGEVIATVLECDVPIDRRRGL